MTIKERVCCPDIELLSVGFRAFYAPRKFPYTVVIDVHIPPRAAPTTACDVIHDAVSRIQTQHPEEFIAITGDFNHVSLSSCLTGFVQYVDCPTRGDRTLDLFYANVKEADRAVSLPPLGRSDHSMVYLQPTYRPCVQTLPVTTRSFRKWSPEASDALRDFLDVKDWAVLLEEEEMDIDMDRRVSTITDYINFCRDTVISVRNVRCYTNNKPWITSDIKDLLNQKKRVFQNGDGEKEECTTGA